MQSIIITILLCEPSSHRQQQPLAAISHWVWSHACYVTWCTTHLPKVVCCQQQIPAWRPVHRVDVGAITVKLTAHTAVAATFSHNTHTLLVLCIIGECAPWFISCHGTRSVYICHSHINPWPLLASPAQPPTIPPSCPVLAVLISQPVLHLSGGQMPMTVKPRLQVWDAHCVSRQEPFNCRPVTASKHSSCC